MSSATASAVSNAYALTQQASLRPNYLHLLGGNDLESLRNELNRGNVPLDLEAKLNWLATGDLSQRFIEQNCRIIIALLLAVRQGAFTGASRAECERLLQVLAYVRKEDDAIPDYRPDGFIDDQQELRAATTELGPLLQSFKVWRLRHQVPGMWLSHTARLHHAA
jgi:hypothetical protein